MLSVKGIFKDGKVIIDEEIKVEKPIQVIVTFLEELETPILEKIDLTQFSFEKAKNLLKNSKESLSEVIIDERRNAI